MKLDDYDKSERFPATVLSTTRITPEDADVDIRELKLEVKRPEFDFDPGQSIGVISPGAEATGNEHHFRLYSVADTRSTSATGRPQITIAVRRCSYLDEYSGEKYDGVSSNFLCDLGPGDQIEITGPYGYAFEVPENKDANLILIGSGTGIAPFRALIKHIYKDVGDWKGKVRLFYGAHVGLEHIYMNEHRDDFEQYYDEATFEAFKAVSPRPHWADPIAWDYCLEERAEEIKEMLAEPTTYVYVAGLERVRDDLDELFIRYFGGRKLWKKQKAKLVAEKRWVELLY